MNFIIWEYLLNKNNAKQKKKVNASFSTNCYNRALRHFLSLNKYGENVLSFQLYFILKCNLKEGNAFISLVQARLLLKNKVTNERRKNTQN